VILTAQYVDDAYGDCGVTSLIIDCGRLAIYGWELAKSTNTKRVVRSNRWIDETFSRLLRRKLRSSFAITFTWRAKALVEISTRSLQEESTSLLLIILGRRLTCRTSPRYHSQFRITVIINVVRFVTSSNETLWRFLSYIYFALMKICLNFFIISKLLELLLLLTIIIINKKYVTYVVS